MFEWEGTWDRDYQCGDRLGSSSARHFRFVKSCRTCMYPFFVKALVYLMWSLQFHRGMITNQQVHAGHFPVKLPFGGTPCSEFFDQKIPDPFLAIYSADGPGPTLPPRSRFKPIFLAFPCVSDCPQYRLRDIDLPFPRSARFATQAGLSRSLAYQTLQPRVLLDGQIDICRFFRQCGHHFSGIPTKPLGRLPPSGAGYFPAPGYSISRM